MAFVTEVASQEAQPLPPDAFRDVGRGAHRRWCEERAVVAIERRERCVANVDNLRDEILGRAPARVAKDPIIVLPKLPGLMDFGAVPSMPFFHASIDSPSRHGYPQCLDNLSNAILSSQCVGEDSLDVYTKMRALADQPHSPVDAERAHFQESKSRPAMLRDNVVARLQGSSSWAQLQVAEPRHAKVALRRAASQPSLPKAPVKPSAPVRVLLPFQSGAVPRVEPWAPHLGARARRAEVEMMQRLRA